MTAIPVAPGSRPLLGHLVPVLRSPLAFFAALPESGDVVEIRLGPRKAYVVCSPDLTDQVLRDDRTFDKGGPLIEAVRHAIGDGVVTCPHSAHRRQRRLVQPAFRVARMPGYAATAMEQVAAVTDSWREGRPLDVVAEMHTLTARVTTATMFRGADLSESELRQIVADLRVVVRGGYRRMLTPPPLRTIPVPGHSRYMRARARLRTTISKIIADYRRRGTDENDLLSMLVAAHDPVSRQDGAPPRLSDTELVDTALTLFLAGIETTGSTLAWALHLTAQHPELEQELHRETDQVLTHPTATYDDLPHLDLTGRIITETLRHRPPVWLMTRTTSHATRLGEHTLPTGADVIYSPYVLHHRHDLYPQPNQFDPHRWTHRGTTPPQHTPLVAFGGGARTCAGDRLATVEATLALATITARWRLTHTPGTRVRTAPRASLIPAGLSMQPTRRTSPR